MKQKHKHKQKRMILSLLFFSAVATMNAQLTIGADNEPSSFSILELISNNSKGLRLPQLTTAQRDDMQATFDAETIDKAMGLQIFNTDTHCVETWNGTEWISVCGTPFAITPKPVCTSLDSLPATVWMSYNLGADPQFDTPKKQIKKLTELGAAAIAGGAVDPYSDIDYHIIPAGIAYRLDATIFGDFYQWGRIKDGHQVRGESDATAVNAVSVTDADYDPVTGQIISGAGLGKHIYGTRDWQAQHTSWSQAQKDALWGNGQTVDYDFGSSSGGAVPNSAGTAFYQKPVKTINDPCPSGWRLPTQDEWERLGAYGCDADTATGDFSTSAPAAIVPSGNPNTTWVSVYNGKVCTTTNNYDWNFLQQVNYHATGYAIYNTASWTAANSTGGYFDGIDWTATTKTLYDDAAPEPLLFLPAAGQRMGINGIADVGTAGYYWSSTVDYMVHTLSTVDVAHILRFFNPNMAHVIPNSNHYRAYGLSVRCVAE